MNRYFIRYLYRYFWRPLSYWFHRPVTAAALAAVHSQFWRPVRTVLALFWRPVRTVLALFWRPVRTVLALFWRPVRTVLALFWRPVRTVLALFWRPVLKLAVVLLFCSFFLWLPYTLSALLLGLTIFFFNFFLVCKKAVREDPWRQRLLRFSHFVQVVTYGCLFFFPFLIPLFYFFFVVLFQYFCGLGEMWAQADNITILPAPAVVNPHRVGLTQAIFDARLRASGVSLDQMRINIKAFLEQLYDRWIYHLEQLQPTLALEEGLPTLEPPKPLPSPFWPANSEDWTFRDWARWLLWRLWPRIYAQEEPADVGLIWLLNDHFPLFDVRWTPTRGFEFGVSFSLPFSSPDSPAVFPLGKHYIVVNKNDYAKLQPLYIRQSTEAELEVEWKLWQRDEDQPYRDAMAYVSDHLKKYPSWKASILQRTAEATTFTELYEIHSEVCLENAQLLFRWHFGCYHEAKNILTPLYQADQTKFELMRPWFCQEYSFSSATCDTAFQHRERTADTHRLWDRLDPYAIADINAWLGHLGRLSFYPLGAVKPVDNEWGALFHYWESLGRPPLARDVGSTGWGPLRDRIYGGHLLEAGQFEKNDWVTIRTLRHTEPGVFEWGRWVDWDKREK